ncbi:MAG: hypothetical protein JRI75_04445 [Deltaproteobacteria bacterium]|nr:hypothetical protein [Deltaproteobacteria bacterium]
MAESLKKEHLLLIVENKKLASEIHRKASFAAQHTGDSMASGITAAIASIIEELDGWAAWLDHNDFLTLKIATKMVELNKKLSSQLNDIAHSHTVREFFETKTKSN